MNKVFYILSIFILLFCFFSQASEYEIQKIQARFALIEQQLENEYSLDFLPQLQQIQIQSEQLDMPKLLVKATLYEGIIKQVFGDYKDSLSKHYAALEVANKVGDIRLLIDVYLAITNLELELERITQAQQYLDLASDLANNLVSKSFEHFRIKHLQARIYLEKYSYREAFNELAVVIGYKNVPQNYITDLLLTKVKVALKLGKPLFAETILEKVDKLDITNQRLKLHYLTVQAQLYLQKGNLKRAIEVAHKALSLTLHTRYLEEQSQLQKLIASCYFQMGEYQKAHLFLKRFVITEKVINTQKRNNKLLQLEAQYSLAQRQQQVDLLEKDNTLKEQKILQQKQKLKNSQLDKQRWLLIGIVISLIVGFAYWRWQSNRYTSLLKQQVAERTNELAERNKRLQALSFTDSLTGLHNRHYFFSTIDQKIKQVSPKNEMVISIIDIDFFKKINDEYGHSAGDLILQSFAHILKQCTRSSDLLVRWGGEEFLLVMPDMSIPEAEEVIERIRLQVESFPFIINDSPLNITCSIGFSAFPLYPSEPHKFTWEQVLELADGGLYLAKEGRRNAWVGVQASNNIIDQKADNIVQNYKELIKNGSLKTSASHSELEFLY